MDFARAPPVRHRTVRVLAGVFGLDFQEVVALAVPPARETAKCLRAVEAEAKKAAREVAANPTRPDLERWLEDLRRQAVFLRNLAAAGDTVVALLGGDEVTVKHLVREGGRHLLRANSLSGSYPDIVLGPGDRLLGVVRAVGRRPGPPPRRK